MYDGLWTVEFQSPIGYGIGVMVLNNGRLLGGDAGYYYSGKYELTGNDGFEGALEVTRFDEGSISVFGDLEQISLSFSGQISEFHFSATAHITNQQELQININGDKKEEI